MIMKRNLSIIILSAAVALCAVSCAIEGSTEPNEAAKAYIEAWMEVNHPGVNPTGIGIYILEDTPGTGAAWTPDDVYVFVDYTITSLSGTVSQTNNEKLSRQLGKYSKVDSYEPVAWAIGEDYCYAGLEELLNGMKVGGTRTAVIPSWLLTVKRYDSAEKYLETSVDASPLIYTITLRGITRDIKEYSLNILHNYVQSTFGTSVDSTYYNKKDGLREGFYFASINQPSDSIIPNGSTGYLWYIGRRLDGQVFDTNIADTAKVHGIYSASKTYEPVSISFADEYSDIKMNESTVITGFQAAMFHMHAYEEASAIFYYGLAYGAQSSTGIPSYSSLRFDLKLVDKQ